MTLLFSLLAMAAAQDCPDPAAAVRVATEHLLLLDETQTEEELRRVEAAFACRPVDQDTLVRFFLLDGALKHTGGDEAGARAAFATAALVDPTVWMSDLGPALEAIYREVATPGGEGTLDVRGTDGYTLRIDGRVRVMPLTLGAGKHLLQVLDGETVMHHREIVVVAGQGTVVETQLAPKTAPKPPAPTLAVHLHAATGFGVALGEELVAGDLIEPATKSHVPMELGLSMERGPLWARVQFGVSPMLSGQLLYLSADEIAGARALVEGGAALGVAFRGFRAGVLGQAMVPSRTGLRAVLSQTLVGPLAVEARAGLNLHNARDPELAATGLVVFRPRLNPNGQ